MRFQRSAPDSPTINLTPLIDVLFLVLMFLVLTATFRGAFVIDLTLPPAESGAPASVTAPGVVRILLSQEGQVSVEDRRLTLDELERLLTNLPDQETRVVLSADGRTPHAGVVAVVDRIRRAGIFGLRIETTPRGLDPA